MGYKRRHPRKNHVDANQSCHMCHVQSGISQKAWEFPLTFNNFFLAKVASAGQDTSQMLTLRSTWSLTKWKKKRNYHVRRSIEVIDQQPLGTFSGRAKFIVQIRPCTKYIYIYRIFRLDKFGSGPMMPGEDSINNKPCLDPRKDSFE